MTFPRQPFVGLALMAALGIVVADFVPIQDIQWQFWTIGFASIGFVLLWKPNTICTYALAGCAFFLIHNFRTRDTAGLRLAADLTDRPRVVTAIGFVMSEPRVRPNGFATFPFQLESIEFEGTRRSTTATMFVRWRGQAKFGDKLKLFGIAEPISRPRNAGEFDMRDYLARRDIRRLLFVRYAEDGLLLKAGSGNLVLGAARRARSWMQDALSLGLSGDSDAQMIIESVSLGVTQETPSDLEEPFQQTGTFHLFAVSGLNVAIVAQLLWVLGLLLRLPRRWTIALIIPALGFYAAITGLQPSSIRAAVMTSVVLLGFFAERKVFTLNSLAASAFFILGWDTNQFFGVGFQLSFAVVFAILLLSDPIFRALRQWTAPDAFLPRALIHGPRHLFDVAAEWLCRGASVSLAAWLGSTPLILWNFHLVTLISLLANLVVVPIAFVVLALALISLLCAPLFSALAIIFNHANWALAHLLLETVRLFAQVPGGHFYLETPRWPKPFAEMTVVDAGVGGSVHVRAHGRDWLFDCGAERTYELTLREYLHARGVNRLDGLLLTHGDSLHIGAAKQVLDVFRPKRLIDNPLPDRSSVHRRVRQVFSAERTNVLGLRAGEAFSIASGVTGRILFPPADFVAKTADDQTYVVQLSVKASKILFMSDSGYATEKWLLQSSADLGSDILVKGQHHSGNSGSEEFLDAVRPRLIIATSRDFPDHERISDEWAEQVQTRGIKLFRQNETGAVELEFGNDRWQARSYLTGEVFRSDNR